MRAIRKSGSMSGERKRDAGPTRPIGSAPLLDSTASIGYYSFRSSNGTCYDYSASGPYYGYGSGLVPVIAATNRLAITVSASNPPDK